MIHLLKLRCLIFLLLIFEMFLHLDWSPPVVNWIDWTWFGKAYTCLYKVWQLMMHIKTITKSWGQRNCLQSSETVCMSSRDPVWRCKKLLGQPSLQHSIDLGLMAQWSNRSLSCERFAKKHLKETQTVRNKILWSDEPRFNCCPQF